MMHAPPRDNLERQRKFALAVDQARQVLRSGAVVDCPCGRRTPVAFAYHCYMCRVWFCTCCAADHFTPAEDLIPPPRWLEQRDAS